MEILCDVQSLRPPFPRSMRRMLMIQQHSRTSEALHSNFLEQTNAIPGDSVTLDKRLSFLPRSSSSSGISSIFIHFCGFRCIVLPRFLSGGFP